MTATSDQLANLMTDTLAVMQAINSKLDETGQKLNKLVKAADSSRDSTAAAPQTGGEVSGASSSGGAKTIDYGNFFESMLDKLDSSFKGNLSGLFGVGDQHTLFGLGRKDEEKSDGKTGDGDAAIAGAEAITQAGEKVTKQAEKDNAALVASDSKKWGAIIGNAVAGSKKLQKINRAMAISTVIVDTARGIAKAFADHGFPGGIVPAAFIAATGAAQIATIKGQAHDGLSHVPSTGTYLLEQGERVVDRRLNRDLKDYLTTQQKTGAGAGARGIANPTVNLTINGDPDPDAVRSNRGALEGMIREIFADHALETPFD